LRSHCRPKTRSSDPTTSRRAEIGTSVSAGPSAATAAASATVAAATPRSEERHPRVIPAARTIVSASTISTALARKAERTRKTALTSPRSAVQRLDLAREVLLANAPLQLQRRRHLALLGGEVAREDREALDLLEPRELGVHVVDDSLKEIVHVLAAKLP